VRVGVLREGRIAEVVVSVSDHFGCFLHPAVSDLL
jgi:hypothetical protein